MVRRNVFGYTIIGLSLLFIISYVIDGVEEKWNSPFGIFAFKDPLLYWLKLIYACTFLFSGIDLLTRNRWTWYLMMFSSIGMLTSCFFIYLYGYVFRSSLLDTALFLEIVSVGMVVLYNVRKIAAVYDIGIPRNRCMILALLTIINFIVNYSILSSVPI